MSNIFLVIVINILIYTQAYYSEYNNQESLLGFDRCVDCIPFNVKLVGKQPISRDVIMFTFQLPSQEMILGVGASEHIKLSAFISTYEYPNGELIERKYTPISRIFEKIYRSNESSNGGKLTPYLEKMNLGAYITINGPFSRFRYLGNGTIQLKVNNEYELRRYNTVIMLAGGSGITPPFSLIQQISEDASDTTQLKLLFSNKGDGDILLKQELIEFQKYGKLTKLAFTLTEPSVYWNGYRGRISQEMLVDAFGDENGETVVLICGPLGFVQLAEKLTQYLGIDKQDVFIF